MVFGKHQGVLKARIFCAQHLSKSLPDFPAWSSKNGENQHVDPVGFMKVLVFFFSPGPGNSAIVTFLGW